MRANPYVYGSQYISAVRFGSGNAGKKPTGSFIPAPVRKFIPGPKVSAFISAAIAAGSLISPNIKPKEAALMAITMGIMGLESLGMGKFLSDRIHQLRKRYKPRVGDVFNVYLSEKDLNLNRLRKMGFDATVTTEPGQRICRIKIVRQRKTKMDAFNSRRN